MKVIKFPTKLRPMPPPKQTEERRFLEMLQAAFVDLHREVVENKRTLNMILRELRKQNEKPR